MSLIDARIQESDIFFDVECETCCSRFLWILKRNSWERIVFCLSCKSLFYLSEHKALVDHDEDFTAFNYLAALNFESEVREYRRILETLIEMLPAHEVKKTLHDVGCGTGHFVSLATEYGFETTGNDIWDQMIFLSEQSGHNVYLGPFNPSKHSELHTVTMLCVLAHMDNPWSEVRKIKRSLNLNGILYFHTPRMCLLDYLAIASYLLSATSFPNLLMRRVNKSHRRIYSQKALSTELEKVGLKILKKEKRNVYGLKYSEYLASIGLSSKKALKIGEFIAETGIDRFFPRNRWSVYCAISDLSH